VSTVPARETELASLGDLERHWAHKLGGLNVRIGGEEPACVQALRTATGHILANRDGPAIQPGPRRYTRSWIRDAATMSAALLRMGCGGEVRDFLAWYATHQAADGNVPCAVDRNGPDWLPEHDSHGQFVFTLAEYLRFTGDRSFAAALWPAAQRALGYLESLIATRRTPEFRTAERRACFGILPESASHEGYLAQPVHAYWDDFWALRGIGDGAELAQSLGEPAEAERLRRLRDELGTCLYQSIATTIATRRLSIPARRPPRSPSPTPPSAWRPPCWRGPSMSTCVACAGGGAAKSTGTTTPRTRSASSARWYGSGVAPMRTSCSSSFSPTGDRRAGINGPRSHGGIRAAPVISATSRTRGSAPSTYWRCSACLPMSGPATQRSSSLPEFPTHGSMPAWRSKGWRPGGDR
jgi:hypothetical protein